MKRSKLKNKTNKTKNPSDIKNYKKHRNYVVQLNKMKRVIEFLKIKKLLMHLMNTSVPQMNHSIYKYGQRDLLTFFHHKQVMMV